MNKPSRTARWDAMSTWRAEIDGLLPRSSVGRMQQFDGITAQGASQVRMGDNYTTRNYFPGHSRDAHILPSNRSMRKLLEPDSLDELLDHFSDALGFLKMTERFAKVATDHADICKWVFETPRFLEWQTRICCLDIMVSFGSKGNRARASRRS